MKKGLPAFFASFLWVFYVIMISFFMSAVLHIDTLENCTTALVFEIIGFFALAVVIIGNIVNKSVKVGYFVPLVVITVVYTIVLDIINMCLVLHMKPGPFTMVNLVLLFIYCLISIPMYVMGKDKN